MISFGYVARVGDVIEFEFDGVTTRTTVTAVDPDRGVRTHREHCYSPRWRPREEWEATVDEAVLRGTAHEVTYGRY